MIYTKTLRFTFGTRTSLTSFEFSAAVVCWADAESVDTYVYGESDTECPSATPYTLTALDGAEKIAVALVLVLLLI